jgi:sugar/nucleoside kinase (ribokinase family)
MLPHVDILLPNETEAMAFTKTEHLGAAVEGLAGEVPILAVKRGPRGGLAREGEREVTAGILPVEVVDTTGAGDSFNAGFLFGFLNDYGLERSLALACACGSLSTRAAGGTTAQPTLDEALSALGTV